MSAKLENRSLPSWLSDLPLELRSEGDGAPTKLIGYAAKFNAQSEPLTDPLSGATFVELIAPGAFARTLRESPDVRALYNHNTSHVLGRVKSGTLRLWEDEVGLRFEVDLPDTSFAFDLKESVRRGDIDGCSFGFVCRDDSITRVGDTVVRTLLDIELYEISTGVAFPAYPATVVSLRSRIPGASPPSTPLLNAARRKLALLEF